MRNKKSLQKKKGFTLIELLVVIAIIAIVSSIVIASVIVQE
jgi:prepilin-type N-terminal cleavage/methylation domain-containing protein